MITRRLFLAATSLLFRQSDSTPASPTAKPAREMEYAWREIHLLGDGFTNIVWHDYGEGAVSQIYTFTRADDQQLWPQRHRRAQVIIHTANCWPGPLPLVVYFEQHHRFGTANGKLFDFDEAKMRRSLCKMGLKISNALVKLAAS